jgi:hypothetical protein
MAVAERWATLRTCHRPTSELPDAAADAGRSATGATGEGAAGAAAGSELASTTLGTERRRREDGLR